MSDDDIKRLTTLRITRDSLIEDLRKLYDSVPEDEVAEGTKKAGYVDYPSYVRKVKIRKDEIKISLEGLERWIKEIEQNL